MPKGKTGKFTAERVQDSWPASDFLPVEVSEEKKAQLDKIQICKPDIPQRSSPVCFPVWCFPKCIPLCIPLCFPHRICAPITVAGPVRVCTPDMVTTPIPPEEIYELYGEMKEMFTALEKMKAEIAEIKKKIK